MSKTTLVILSDPRGGEEALGRLFNALAAAHDFAQRKQEVQIVFQGAGTRWAGVVTQPEHPAHALYRAVQDKVVGVSSACSVAFGARDQAVSNGFSLLADNAVPGTTGLPSLAAFAREGTVITF